MVVFHGAWDLTLFGGLPPGTMQAPGWWVFARLIAGSFLFLSGMGLWLAHDDGLRWRAFLRRLSVLMLAAAAISLTTRIAMPDTWIRFGILHAIAASSCVGILVLRVPKWLLAGLVAAILMISRTSVAAFSSPVWLWTGLGAGPPPDMLDYAPLFPWLGVFLLGLLTARMFNSRLRYCPRSPGPIAQWLAWPGRHSLAIYLLHQPVLFGLLYLVSLTGAS